MKRLLLAACLLGPAAAHAQTTPTTEAAVTYRYCALLVDDRFFTSPGRLYLDYGQGAPGAVDDPEMAEMAKNIRQSRAVIDVLNYLGRHKWELVSVMPVQTKERLPTGQYEHEVSIETETRYFFRRRTP